MEHVADIQNLHVRFVDRDVVVYAVRGVSLHVAHGETLALVGESGCGKSVTALSLARLNPEPPAVYTGQVQVCGRDVLELSPRALHTLRGHHVAYVFQDPGASLNPVYTIGFQLRETLRLHQPKSDAEAEAVALLQRVGIADPALRLAAYPHALSGGMQQRVMIAMALACQPELLVADEPTTALDVTIQAQVLALLKDVQRERGMALLLITHNLGLVGDVAERVCVMYGGMIVEYGPARAVLRDPRHPYTRGLRAAVPRLRGGTALTGIPGSVPDATQVGVGCPFAPRCDRAGASCTSQCPPLQPCDNESARAVRCFHPVIEQAS